MSQILTIRQIIEGVRAKNFEATLLFVDIPNTFDSIHRGKWSKYYRSPESNCYRNKDTLQKHQNKGSLTNFFDIITEILHEDT